MLKKEDIEKTANTPKDWLVRRVHSHFADEHVPEKLQHAKIDGTPKSKLITNWVKFITNFHTFLTLRRPLELSVRAEFTPVIQSLCKSMKCALADRTNYLSALLYGEAVELITFDGDELRAESQNPMDWTLIKDDRGRLVSAIYKITLNPPIFYRGELQTKPLEKFIVYEKESIRTFVRGRAGVVLESETENMLGRLPVVTYRIDENARPFFFKTLLENIDAYNVTRSALHDTCGEQMSSLLVLKNHKEWEKLLNKKKSQDGKEHSLMSIFQQLGYLPLPDGAEAEYLERTVELEKIKYDLEASYTTILTGSGIPDLSQINIGEKLSGLSNISSSAIKIGFENAVNLNSSQMGYFYEGIRDRWDVVNRYQGLLNRTRIDIGTMEIYAKISAPQNATDWMQYLANLKEVLPMSELYRQLPFIDDPERVLEEFRQERAVVSNEGVQEAN